MRRHSLAIRAIVVGCGLAAWGLAAWGLAAFGLAACAVGSVPGPEIRLSGGAHFELHGVPPVELTRLAHDPRPEFAIRVANAERDAPAMAGSYSTVDGVLRFTPEFALAPGVRYRASYRDVTQEFVIARPDPGPRVRVAAVYPTSSVLPENVLRFYLQFSGAMSHGVAYEHIELLDASGKPVELPFLELAEELWDPAGTRLTLLVDPGRIKNELLPKLEVGPVFESGRSYTLVIAAAWPDGNGRPLAETFRKPIRIAAADTTQPDPERWRVAPPPIGSRTPLVVTFPEPLDHGVLQRMIRVFGPDESQLPGEIEVGENETQWRFRPDAAWLRGRHHLLVDMDLEDPSGNNIRSRFEVDAAGGGVRRVEASAVRVPFELR